MVEVLRRGADEGNAADVDLLDDVLRRGARGNGLLERERSTMTRSISGMPYRASCRWSFSRSRRAKMPPNTFGCRVFTRPPKMDG